jgi:hypothetical protein
MLQQQSQQLLDLLSILILSGMLSKVREQQLLQLRRVHLLSCRLL